MDRAADLRRLAQLLRIAAQTARLLGDRAKKHETSEIHWIARQIEDLAGQLGEICESPESMDGKKPWLS